jgi:hypothetical protein
LLWTASMAGATNVISGFVYFMSLPPFLELGFLS